MGVAEEIGGVWDEGECCWSVYVHVWLDDRAIVMVQWCCEPSTFDLSRSVHKVLSGSLL